MSGLLDPTARLLEAKAAQVQAEGRFPSLAAGVVRDGGLVWSTGRGRSVRRGSTDRPDADTQYKIGSLTKTMTAALVLRARELGLLELDDRIGRFVPEGPFADATLRSLLSHTSGLSAEPSGSWWERSPGVDYAALVAAHDVAGRVLRDGETFHYSNLGYGLLGEVLARVHASTWWDCVRDQLLEPLGMKRTSYQGEPPHAEGFSVEALTGLLQPEPLPDTGSMAPAGQLWSTLHDLATWASALVDPDRGILTAESQRAMRTPLGGSPDDRVGSGYGLGLSTLVGSGRMLVGHGGSMPGFICGFQIDVDSGVGAVVLTNGSYGLSELTAQLIDCVLEQEPVVTEEWLPTEDVPPDVRDALGVWHWGNAPSTLRVDGDELALEAHGIGRRMRFRRVGPDRYVGTSGYLAGEDLRVVRTPEGQVSHLEAATFVYTRTPYDPTAPIPGAGTEPD